MLPTVGANTLSSAICMDKYFSKTLLQKKSIPVLPAVKLKYFDYQGLSKNILFNNLEKELKFPLIVKPNNLGSSIGISKVTNKAELEKGLDKAFMFAFEVLVEHGIEPLREINCAVLGTSLDPSTIQPSMCEEPIVNEKILSFDNKYMSGDSKKSGFKSPVKGKSSGMQSLSRQFPANIPLNITKTIQEYSKKAFATLGLSGVVRIDFLLDSKNNVYLNEINTIPGSLSYYLWDFDYKTLINKLIDFALYDFRVNEKLTYTFNSSVLIK
jgi:D-alanine-D-alanine ligase